MCERLDACLTLAERPRISIKFNNKNNNDKTQEKKLIAVKHVKYIWRMGVTTVFQPYLLDVKLNCNSITGKPPFATPSIS